MARRKFGRRRRPRKGGKSLRKTIVKVATQIVRHNVETNHYMSLYAPTVMSPACTFFNLTAPSCTVAGSGFCEPRQGVRCRTLGIKIRYHIQANTTATAPMLTRLFVFRWRPNSTSEAPTDGYLLAIPTGSSPNNGPMSPFAWNAKKNYTMLVDKHHTLYPTYLQGGAAPVSHAGVISLAGKKVHAECSFDNPASDVGYNHFFIAFCSDQPTNKPTLTFNWEYLWEDA